jgi:hypothetical protein
MLMMPARIKESNLAKKGEEKERYVGDSYLILLYNNYSHLI